MVEGINSNGIARCRTVGQGFVPGTSVNPTQEECTNGDIARLVWVANQLRVTCSP
jgi:hypothetical protein